MQALIANITRFNCFEFALCSHQFNEERLTHEQKLVLYRIIQEQLNNIIKHAAAKKVTITLSLDAIEQVHLIIHDNGRGFDQSKVKAGIGLRNITSRIQALKGHVDIQSIPGLGCKLTASFFVNSHE
ncbi:MAG: sensor histidine kinase [Agriterribacter sp.]